MVDRLTVDPEQAHEPVRARLQRTAALHRAQRATGLDGREVPRPRLEAVRLRGQRADRADLHRVPGEVRRERLTGEGLDLGVAAPLAERDERIAGDLLGEAGAARALDAALAVEQDEVGERDRLLPVPLLLGEARLARAERERRVLQRALAAAVAHRAVERMVDEQQLEYSVLRALHRRRLRGHDHAVGHRRGARGRETTDALDLDEAHATHSDRLHALVPAEARDVRPVLLRGLDQHLALRHLDGAPVDGDRHLLGHARSCPFGAGRRTNSPRNARRPRAGFAGVHASLLVSVTMPPRGSSGGRARTWRSPRRGSSGGGSRPATRRTGRADRSWSA